MASSKKIDYCGYLIPDLILDPHHCAIDVNTKQVQWKYPNDIIHRQKVKIILKWNENEKDNGCLLWHEFDSEEHLDENKIQLSAISSILLGKDHQGHIGDDSSCMRFLSEEQSKVLYVELESKDKRTALLEKIKSIIEENQGILSLTRYIFPQFREHFLSDEEKAKKNVDESKEYIPWDKMRQISLDNTFIRYRQSNDSCVFPTSRADVYISKSKKLLCWREHNGHRSFDGSVPLSSITKLYYGKQPGHFVGCAQSISYKLCCSVRIADFDQTIDLEAHTVIQRDKLLDDILKIKSMNCIPTKQTLLKVFPMPIDQDGILLSSKLPFVEGSLDAAAKSTCEKMLDELKKNKTTVIKDPIKIKMVIPGGAKLRDVIAWNLNSVHFPNIFSFDAKTRNFVFHYMEEAQAYGEKETTIANVTTRFHVDLEHASDKGLMFSSTLQPITKWGISFACTIVVAHPDGNTFAMYIPGERSYDPAGMTGDPHASERIGASCAAVQLAITLAQLAALNRGATLDQVKMIQDDMRKLIVRYHGRVVLFEWMYDQIKKIVNKKEVLPYPQFILEQVELKMMDLNKSNRKHTQKYLDSYKKDGDAYPSIEYYKKVIGKESSLSNIVDPFVQSKSALVSVVIQNLEQKSCPVVSAWLKRQVRTKWEYAGQTEWIQWKPYSNPNEWDFSQKLMIFCPTEAETTLIKLCVHDFQPEMKEYNYRCDTSASELRGFVVIPMKQFLGITSHSTVVINFREHIDKLKVVPYILNFHPLPSANTSLLKKINSGGVITEKNSTIRTVVFNSVKNKELKPIGLHLIGNRVHSVESNSQAKSYEVRSGWTIIKINEQKQCSKSETIYETLQQHETDKSRCRIDFDIQSESMVQIEIGDGCSEDNIIMKINK